MGFLSASTRTARKLYKSQYLKTAFTASLLGGTTVSGFSSSSSTTTTCSATMNPVIKVIPNDKLYISEPDPQWFGNEPNPSSLGDDDDDDDDDDSSTVVWTNQNWLKSRFHFSFAEYNNPQNNNFGVLRVMNDDLVQPHRGFGTHSHGNMEIITYIVHGELTHQDNMGTKETLGRGSVQFMTAGTGVRHSEFNHGDKPLRFIQTWIVPATRGLKPNYGSYSSTGGLEEGFKKNELVHLVSNVAAAAPDDDDDDDTAATANMDEMVVSSSTPVKINQDVNVHAAQLELGKTVTIEIPVGCQSYLLCIEGKLSINNNESSELSKYDGCEIISHGGSTLTIKAVNVEETEHGEVAHFLIFTMKEVPGSGRKDIKS